MSKCQQPLDWDAYDAASEEAQACIDPNTFFGCEVDAPYGNQAAIEDASSSSGGMAPCPTTLDAGDSPPEGWRDYSGNPSVFHCGYRGILENVTPSPDRMMNECFYDETGALVDEDHPYAGCGGTPDAYDSRTDPWDHTFNDPGGIWEAGWDAFWTSRGFENDQFWEGARNARPGDGRIDHVLDPDNPGLVKPWEPKF